MDSYTCHLDNRSILGPNSPSHPVSHLFSETSAGDCFHHSKADSAYSSISGSSILPDFLPFLPDEFQAQSLTYMDLKFLKAKNNLPSFELDSKGIYHLYNSIQTITQNQERTRISNIESLAHMPPLPSSPPHTRVQSSVSPRNLDNSRAHQNPEGQFYEFPSLCYSSNTESYADLHCDRRPFQQRQNNHLPSGAETNILEAASPLDSLERSPHEVDHSYETDSGQPEKHWIRSDSAPSPGQQSLSSCSNTHNVINESVQNKGHFYFVTGVIKPKEYDHVSMETSSELSRQSCPEDGNGKLFFQEQYKPNCNHFPNNIVEHHNVSATNTPDDREQRTMSRDCSRHHSITHQIFYSGPENGSAGTTLSPALNKEKQISHSMASKFINKALKTQLDVTNEKISKEKTPLLYHLAGAYRASCASKFRNSQGGIKTVDGVKKDLKTVTNGQHSGCSEYLNTAASKNDCKFSDPKCETLDDSFKKYYKEKLKDAQCRVLKETSFKRRDLQLSAAQMFRQQSGKHLFAVPHKSPEAQQTGSNNPNVQYNNQATVSGINKDLSKKVESGMDAARPPNVAQPQVPRVRSRKRLMADLKKLSRSEPEKLHQLPDVPTHMACRSLGNECDNLLSGSHLSRVLSVQMFETSGRLPATNFPKTTLKLLRQNALVEYMQRKTGQRVSGSQQLASHLSSDRVSVAEKLLAWSSRHKSSHLSSKKFHWPISVLDSTSRSVKDDLFVTSSTNCWPTARKSGSVESLLERPERPALFRARSTSTPHTFQAWKRCPDFQVALKQDVCSSVEAKQEPKECEDAKKMWPADAERTKKAIECHKDENVASNLSTEMPGVPPALSSPEYTHSPEVDDGTYSPHKEDGNKLAGAPLAVEELKNTENEAHGEVVQAFPRLHWEALVKEVVSADWTLARTFYPLSNRKTALMLMEQLLSEDSVLMEEHYKKKQEQRVDCTQMITHSSEMTIPPPSVKDQSVSNTNHITEMKLQLKEYLEEELKVLEAELKVLEEEEQENQQWSRHLEARVRSSCDPPQLQRYTQFLQDLERVLSLLLCLSARLARVQNALSAGFCDRDPEDRESLESRYRLLCKQRDDAKDLKENLDRRECLVSGFLCERLPAAQLSEYRRFLQAKASLLIRRKELEEKRRVAEERVDVLLDSVSHRSYVPIASQCLSLCTRDKNAVGGLF